MEAQSLEKILADLECLPTGAGRHQLQLVLAEKINEMILHDFDRLTGILYRIDVDEKKLRKLLQEQNSADAGFLIAGMILDRQEEKQRSRAAFPPPSGIPEEDRW